MISALEDTAIETIQHEEKDWGNGQSCSRKPVDSTQQPDESEKEWKEGNEKINSKS